jgi:hypothetical protein
MRRDRQISKKLKGPKVKRKIVQGVITRAKRRPRRRRLREIRNSRRKNSKWIRDKKNQKSKNSVSSLCAEKSSKG